MVVEAVSQTDLLEEFAVTALWSAVTPRGKNGTSTFSRADRLLIRLND